MIGRDEARAALTGPITSIHTPFERDGSIDYAGLRRHIDFCLAAGSKTMLLTAGDSLFFTLSDQEIADVTRAVVQHTRRRAMVVAADRNFATPQAIAFARFARQAGADLVMILPAGWGSGECTKETLLAHYAAVAAEMPAMIVTGRLSDWPMAQGLELIETLRDRVPGILAVKDDICGEFGCRLGTLVHESWAILTGIKRHYLEVWPYGVDGYFSTFSKFKPAVAQGFWRAMQAGDLAAATGVITTYEQPYFDLIAGLTGGVRAGLHGTLELYGICGRWKRPPYHSLSDTEMERLAEFLRQKGIL